MDRQRLIDRIRDLFRARANRGLACAYLFGSRARGSERPDSDVDLAVLNARTPAPTLEEGLGLGLGGELEEALGLPVDIVVLNTASADLVHRVLRDGILVYDADPSARIRFEVKARNDYFDLLPILRQYRRQSGSAPRPRGHPGPADEAAPE